MPTHTQAPPGSAGVSERSRSKDGDSASGDAPTKQATSLSKAVARVELQKQYAQQRAAELKVAEELNELFKHKSSMRNQKILERFWEEVKARLTKKFGNIPKAFYALDSSGDGSLSFLEFVDMLRLINLPMDQRVVRGLFDKASGGDRALSLEEMKTLLLDKTIRKLRFVMEGFNGKQERVQAHIHRFIRRLTQTDETNHIRAVDRFQRKLTLEFCCEMWRAFLDKVNGGAGNPPIDKKSFIEVMTSFVQREDGTRLLAYEVTFMQRLFDRIDRHERGLVGASEFAVVALMLGTGADRLAKAAAAFDFFDSDGDGCLLYEEILELCLCVCAHRPIVEMGLRHSHELDFQEELSAQEGRRTYELALWHMQRTGKVSAGIATKAEWVSLLERLPDILDCLIPGSVRMRWAMEPTASERERSEPTSPVWPPTKQTFPVQVSASPNNFGGFGGRPTQSPLLPPSRRGPGLTAFSEDEVVLANRFRSHQTRLFRQTLSGWGDLRLAELTSGFIASPDPPGGEDSDAAAASSGAGAGTGAGSSASGARASGTSNMRRASVVAKSNSAPTLLPAGGTTTGSFGIGARSPASRGSGGVSGAGAAPPRPTSPALSLGGRSQGGAVARRPARKTKTPLAASAGTLPQVSPSKGRYGTEGFCAVPAVPAEKWGADSADRFRLFAAVTIASGRHTIDRPDPGAPLTHKCIVCLGNHKFTVDAKA